MAKAKTKLTIAETIARLTRVGQRLGMDTAVSGFQMDTIGEGKPTRWVNKVPKSRKPTYRLRSGRGTCTGDGKCTGTDIHMAGCPVLIAAVEAAGHPQVMSA